MNSINYNQTQFLKSAPVCSALPPDEGAEVAFVGRSNSGKSSAINAITGLARLARTSKTPGRTQAINLFTVNDHCRLVDLPGYGFAKVPDAMRYHWEKVMNEYFTERECLKGIILLMDIRHPLTGFDWQMIEWTASRDLSLHVLLTKTDKLKRAAARQALLAVQKELHGYEDFVSVQLFSAVSKVGIDEVRMKLDQWLSNSES